jgi:beta-aspartyl-dipeptidase (metallo-type)
MLKLIKNGHLYSPSDLGKKDILIADSKIIAIDNQIELSSDYVEVFDFSNKIIVPGFIDQHIHIMGAGGKDGYSSMTPDIKLTDLIACGSTTVVGLLGTDGSLRNIKSLYSKAKALEQEGITAYMYCGYYGVDSVTITDSIQGDMIFIDNVLGCKIAISDIRSSYPSAIELVRKLRDIRVAGSLACKKGILHIHLGNLPSKMDVLFELVHDYGFPIEHISPTHVARTKELFEQAIEFAKLGGMIDITTGASKYTEPYLAVLYALEKGASIDQMTFSTDGHAGLSKKSIDGLTKNVVKAPINTNLTEVINLIKLGNYPISEALKLITCNPAKNLGLAHKGKIEVGCDADFNAFDHDLNLVDVFAKGKQFMSDGKFVIKGVFE